jgi:hypothetical protein
MSETMTPEMLAKLINRVDSLEAELKFLGTGRTTALAPAILSSQQMQSRRSLLKYLAATATVATVGTAFIGSGESAFAETSGADEASPSVPGDFVLPAAPTTPGTRYLTIPGSAFVDELSTGNYDKQIDFGTLAKTAADGNDYIAGFTLPQGAIITELIAYFVKPTAVNTSFFLKRHDLTSLSGNQTLFLGSNSGSPVNTNLQELAVPVSGGVTVADRTVDNTTRAYSVLVVGLPFATPNNHQFKAFRIGYTVPFAGDLYFLGTPVRVAASTNSGGSLALLTSDGSGNPTVPQTIQITGGTSGIPADAKGIFGSLTSVGALAPGNLRLWPTGATAPTVNSLNIPSRDGVPLNLTTSFIVGLNATGQVNLAYSNSVASSTCGFSIDVVGYFV